MPERRNFTRVKFTADVQIELKNKVFVGELQDISLNGALFNAETQVPVEAGNHFELSFYLPSSDITLTFNAELVHHHEKKLGFKFLSEDIDTMIHLRRLLELNVGDGSKISAELSFLTPHNLTSA